MEALKELLGADNRQLITLACACLPVVILGFVFLYGAIRNRTHPDDF